MMLLRAEYGRILFELENDGRRVGQRSDESLPLGTRFRELAVSRVARSESDTEARGR